MTKQELIDLICELSKIENDVKLSSQKLIILQTGLIKLCNKEKANFESNNIVQGPQNSDLEKRVTKIENFLRAGNFVANNNKNIKYEVSAPKKNNVVKPSKPKYEGKTQDYWPKLVEDFKKDGKMFMYINLAGSVAREVNDMTLEIQFPNGLNKVAKDFLSRPDNKQSLKNTIHLACGKEMQIKFVGEETSTKQDKNEFEAFVNNANIPFNII